METVKKTAKKTEWKANETQVAFMETLKELGRPATLKEINAVSGKNFKSGSINTLITKLLVATVDVDVPYAETKTYKFESGEVTVTADKTETKKAYFLVENAANDAE